jgi:hypothetical protein
MNSTPPAQGVATSATGSASAAFTVAGDSNYGFESDNSLERYFEAGQGAIAPIVLTCIIRTSQMKWNSNSSSAGILTYAILDFRFWILEQLNRKSKIGNPKSAYSCGTAADSHCTFPVTSGDCSPPEPMKYCELYHLVSRLSAKGHILLLKLNSLGSHIRGAICQHKRNLSF